MLSEDASRVSVTGATGFIGRRFVADCVSKGLHVSALTRSPQPPSKGVRWVKGDLNDAHALTDLVEGADVMVHLAGATKALRRKDFCAVNTDATVALAKICAAQDLRHFVFLSSLAATRPNVSPYATSKAAAEDALLSYSDAMTVSVIRAPAVLGPGDSATHPLFSNLAKGLLVVPSSARQLRFSVIDVQDLSDLLINTVTAPRPNETLIAPYGHLKMDWATFSDSAHRILNRPIKTLYLPSALTRLSARVVDVLAFLSKRPQVFSTDKLGEINAGDWIAEHAVDTPLPFDETMRRCLAPYVRRNLKTA